MKLNYITNLKLPTEKAHGWQIAKMCEEFGRAGAEVTLVTSYRQSHIKEDVFAFYDLEKNFEIRTLGRVDWLRYEKVFRRAAFLAQRIGFLARLFFFRPGKGTVVYTRDIEIAWLFSRRGYRTVYEAHNFRGRVILRKFLLKKVFLIVAITEGLKRAFRAAGFREGVIEVFPDGVDLEKFEISTRNVAHNEADPPTLKLWRVKQSRLDLREKLGLPREAKIALYVGSFKKWKGVETIFEAAKLLPEILFVFVGGEIKEASVNVKVVGYQNRRQVPIWLKAADVLILPNLAEEEISRTYTSPIKMFEYMAVGQPIVASDLPSIREVLSEQNAFLFTAGRPESLAEAAREVFLNEAEAKRRGEAAFKEVLKYTWKRRAEQILKIIFQ